RLTLGLALAATVFAFLVGVTLGFVAGILGGRDCGEDDLTTPLTSFGSAGATLPSRRKVRRRRLLRSRLSSSDPTPIRFWSASEVAYADCSPNKTCMTGSVV
ncbi:MAG: hypothetical protein AAGB18_05595, partial [Pseudomonadota bacterium]